MEPRQARFLSSKGISIIEHVVTDNEDRKLHERQMQPGVGKFKGVAQCVCVRRVGGVLLGKEEDTPELNTGTRGGNRHEEKVGRSAVRRQM